MSAWTDRSTSAPVTTGLASPAPQGVALLAWSAIFEPPQAQPRQSLPGPVEEAPAARGHQRRDRSATNLQVGFKQRTNLRTKGEPVRPHKARKIALGVILLTATCATAATAAPRAPVSMSDARRALRAVENNELAGQYPEEFQGQMSLAEPECRRHSRTLVRCDYIAFFYPQPGLKYVCGRNVDVWRSGRYIRFRRTPTPCTGLNSSG